MPMTSKPEADPEAVDLAVSTDKVCYIIAKAREFDGKEGDSDPDSGSNETDDGGADVLEDKPGDSVQPELVAFINSLDEEEQITLVALAWLGRGTYDVTEWDEALSIARSEHNKRTAQYLLGLPLLGDYLEEGLDAFGLSCTDYDPSLR